MSLVLFSFSLRQQVKAQSFMQNMFSTFAKTVNGIKNVGILNLFLYNCDIVLELNGDMRIKILNSDKL